MASPEQALWSAVVAQALTDATQPLNIHSSGERAARKRARDWFIDNSEHFQAACYRADLEPERVRSHALLLIAEASKGDLPPRERKPPKPRGPYRQRNKTATPGVVAQPTENANDRPSSIARECA